MPVRFWQTIIRFWFFLGYLITTVNTSCSKAHCSVLILKILRCWCRVYQWFQSQFWHNQFQGHFRVTGKLESLITPFQFLDFTALLSKRSFSISKFTHWNCWTAPTWTTSITSQSRSGQGQTLGQCQQNPPPLHTSKLMVCFMLQVHARNITAIKKKPQLYRSPKETPGNPKEVFKKIPGQKSSKYLVYSVVSASMVNNYCVLWFLEPFFEPF
mgnify:CR=1 FL=1